MVRAVRTWLRRTIATCAAVLTMPTVAVFNVTPTANAFSRNVPVQLADISAGGNSGASQATLEFPSAGNHAWPYWVAQLQARKPDLIATLNG